MGLQSFTADWQDIRVLHRNRLPSRSYFIPFASEEQALNYVPVPRDQIDSDLLYVLNGEWDFAYYKSISLVPVDIVQNYKNYTFHKQYVPHTWQSSGYEPHFYINARYPIPAVDPYVPMENPTGVYVRTFKLPEKWADKDVYITFQGVSSSFHLYVNGQPAGYSEGSHLTAEFDITGMLQQGTNTLVCLVYKWCSGTYLECQDMFRSNGIFRDVYLTALNKDKIWDFNMVTSRMQENHYEFLLDVDVIADKKNVLCVKVVDSESNILYEKVSETDQKRVRFQGKIMNCRLWSAEEPNLYTLLITLKDDKNNMLEVIRHAFGFRTIEIKGEIFYYNDQPIKLKGVNRHDSNPDTGYYTSFEDMVKDITLMKALQVNAIRTSHYPNDPLFMELCDLYGFYVIDETDIESHGAASMDEGYDHFATSLLYKESFIDRMTRTLHRDKNNTCVTIFSLGNESGYGENHDLIAALCKRIRPGIPVQYEGYYAQRKEGYDIVSAMYPSLDTLREYCKNPSKPFFMCEYLHAMGLGPGGFKEYWEIIDDNPCMMGGCVWEWCDHASVSYIHGEKVYHYGGDHGEYLHDENFCVDGLVYPDRRLSSSAYAMKHAYRPVKVQFDGENLRLFNTRYFTSTEDLSFSWQLLKNGVVVSQEPINDIVIMPRTLQEFKPKLEFEGEGEYYLNVNCYQGENHLSTEQFFICNDVSEDTSFLNPRKLKVTENAYTFEIKGDNFAYVISKLSGTFTSIHVCGKEILYQGNDLNKHVYIPSGPRIQIFRAPTDNDKYIKNEWYAHKYHMLWNVYHSYETVIEDALFKVSFEGYLCAPSLSPSFKAAMEYTVSGNGDIAVTPTIEPLKSNLPYLPKFGVSLYINPEFQNVEYYGMGEGENYPDFLAHTRMGLFKCLVDDLREDYIRPQESGNRSNCRFAKLSGSNGHIMINGKSFHFNASNYDLQTVLEAKHYYELKKSDYIQVSVDGFVSGLGSNSCGYQPLDKYKVKPEKLQYSFTIKF